MPYVERNATVMLTAMMAAMIFGCTERIDLAPVRIGYQNLNETFPPEPRVPAAKASAPLTPGRQFPPPAPAKRYVAPAKTKAPPSKRQASGPTAPTSVGILSIKSENQIRPDTTASVSKVGKQIKPDAAPDKAVPKSRTDGKKADKKTSASSTKKDDAQLRFGWPLDGTLLKNYAQTGRKGIKIAGKKGQAVRAAESGKVVYSGQGLIGYGNLLIIKHNDQYLTAYANNNVLLAKEGDMVKKGQEIATVGIGASRKAMLHFEIRKQGKSVNPLILLPKL
jgi:lipoprotein NlpD